MNKAAFTMSRFLSVWHIEGEIERDRNLVYVYEQLDYTEPLTEADRPYWGIEIQFYRPETNTWIHCRRHLLGTSSASPEVFIAPDGLVFECTGGSVVWRDGRWCIRWSGYVHTRAARLVRAGLEWWKDADREMPEAVFLESR